VNKLDHLVNYTKLKTEVTTLIFGRLRRIYLILRSGNNIDLKPNFHAANGSNFSAFIGRVANTPERYYYLKDHLGSIRVVVNETGDIVSSDDYDPWGMILEGRSTDNNYHNAKYKFTGKERDKETGYDYFGARYFDSRIGRWLRVDPLFDKHPEWSPYNYVLNNPLKIIDPDGKQVSVNKEIRENPVAWNRLISSTEFKIAVSISGLGGEMYGKFPIAFRTGNTLAPGITNLFYKGTNVNKLQHTPISVAGNKYSVWKLGEDLSSYYNQITLNLNKMDESTIGHELSHTAYNLMKYKAKSDNPEADVFMFTGAEQHFYTNVKPEYKTGMSDKELVQTFNIDIKAAQAMPEKEILERIEIK
jgi:RHS repeat-associated protein